MNRRALLPAGAAALGLAATAHAGAEDNESTFERVRRTKVLRVAALPGEAPFFRKDVATGEWGGIAIDITDRLEMEAAAGNVFLPALYPGSHEHPDDQTKLGRTTDWKSSDTGPVLGVGARTFLVDDDALGLLEWRELMAS